jgi:DNA-binding MarR family transcriptional regulator
VQAYHSIRNELSDIRLKNRCKMLKEMKKQNVDVTPVDHKVLVKLMMAGSLSQKMLAESLRRDKAQIARIVARLHAQGLIDKIEDPKDKRSVKLTMAAKGIETLKWLDALEMEIVKKMLGNFALEEVEIFSAMLTRINKNLDGT